MQTLSGSHPTSKQDRSDVGRIAASLVSKGALLTFFFLILFHPRLGIRFASDGLILWYQTVVPTLLPCMLLSSLIVQTNSASGLIALIHPVLGRLLGTSPGGTYCFLIGLLCGYPMGAKTCADMIRSESLSPKEGQYLMAFLHFPSPMFVTGYIAASHLVLPSSLPILAAVYLPVIPLSLLSRWRHPCRGWAITGGAHTPRTHIPLTPALLDDIIASCSAVMIRIGIYMMLFTVLAGFVMSIPMPTSMPMVLASASANGIDLSLLQTSLVSAVCGLLEMTTGIQLAAQTGLSLAAKGALICFIASFGGLSVAMQTQSVLAGSGLTLRQYLPWQLLHGIFAALIFLLFL